MKKSLGVWPSRWFQWGGPYTEVDRILLVQATALNLKRSSLVSRACNACRANNWTTPDAFAKVTDIQFERTKNIGRKTLPLLKAARDAARKYYSPASECLP